MKLRSELRPQDITAIVDTREQRPLDLTPLRTIRGTLTTGDYGIVGLTSISIERKSLPDLLSCVGQERERFQREVDRLLGIPARCLVIESTWEEIERGQWRSRVKPASVIGSLLGWMMSGLPVAMCGDHQRAGKYVSRMLFIAARRRYRECRSLVGSIFETETETPDAEPETTETVVT